MEAMDGPINFGENDKFWGLLIEGFKPPSLGMNYDARIWASMRAWLKTGAIDDPELKAELTGAGQLRPAQRHQQRRRRT